MAVAETLSISSTASSHHLHKAPPMPVDKVEIASTRSYHSDSRIPLIRTQAPPSGGKAIRRLASSRSEDGLATRPSYAAMPNYDIRALRRPKKLPISLAIVTVLAFLGLGAVVFTIWEEWNLLDGAYYSFITLSTIGFGDMVPGKSYRSGEVGLSALLAVPAVWNGPHRHGLQAHARRRRPEGALARGSHRTPLPCTNSTTTMTPTSTGTTNSPAWRSPKRTTTRCLFASERGTGV